MRNTRIVADDWELDILPIKGTKALTYMVTCGDKKVVLSTLCSLLNTVRAMCLLSGLPGVDNCIPDLEI